MIFNFNFVMEIFMDKYEVKKKCYCRICMKHIDAAMVRLENKQDVAEKDLSLVERILAKETDPKMAYILALDLILVGIDTVRFFYPESWVPSHGSEWTFFTIVFFTTFQISIANCSILYQLATRPEEQEKIYQELKKIIPNPSSPLTTQNLDEAIYMKAFIREVFRWVLRKTLRLKNL